MGFFGIFSKKDSVDKQKTQKNQLTQEAPPSAVKNDVKRSTRLNTKAERLMYVKDNCELVAESGRQIEEAKAEYQAVTSYLTDMQKIDLIPTEQRDTLEDAARKIINLTKERNKLQKKDTNISDRQYRLFERYEIQIPKELPIIKEGENYQGLIQKDMEHLEKEKRDLTDAQEDIVNKQAFLKAIAITTSVIIILLFGLFVFLGYNSETNLTIPFLLTVLMGMASALYLFMEARKNYYDIKLVQMKQSRQITLMNKVKIKSVNNRNYLEYTYNKYMADNYEQLKNLWEEYVKIKDESRRYQNNTELLEFYNSELIRELKKVGVSDSEIWIYQPNAILDDKEMVEVRHRLNVRRQKLRERIDLNTKQIEEAMQAITAMIKAFPDCEEEAARLLRRYRIQENCFLTL